MFVQFKDLQYTIETIATLPHQCLFHKMNLTLQNVPKYLDMARDMVMLFFGCAVVWLRYRGQSNTLINIIRRDGGIYYVSMFALGTVTACLTYFGRTTVQSDYVYYAAQELRYLAYPILSNRLLLNLKAATNPTTQASISVILFATTKEDSSLETDHNTIGISTELESSTPDVPLHPSHDPRP